MWTGFEVSSVVPSWSNSRSHASLKISRSSTYALCLTEAPSPALPTLMESAHLSTSRGPMLPIDLSPRTGNR